MKDKVFGSIILLIVIVVLGLFLAPFIKQRLNEGFRPVYNFKSNDLTTPGEFPISVDQAILNDFPLIGKNYVSNDSASEMWWKFPIFGVSSYKQLTNNLRYFKNPDIGICTRPEFCGALYHDIKNKSNIILPLPEAEEGKGARVGYYRTEPNNLFWSIPTNENILY
jgi:hypothetical protein